jgi:O-antigen ligase
MSRYPVILLLAFVVLLGSLVAVLATLQARDEQLRGYVNPLDDAPLPHRVPRLGVNAELRQYTETGLRDQLTRMSALGVTWVRQFVDWDQIEPERGTFNWSAWDTIAGAFRDYPELQAVAVLNNSPAWARDPRAPEPRSLSAPPADPADFAAFARAFAERYGDVIDVYQLWDEPNLASGWGGLEPRPAAYAALLEAGYSAIHGADARATVVAAALAPTVETGGRNVSDWLYIRDLYALGAHAYFDAAAAKPYGFSSSPLDRTVHADELNFSRIVALRDIMLEYGDGSTALWASNWGWNSLPAGWDGEPSIWGQVDAPTQAAYTLDAIDRAEREWPWMGGMILYHWQPDAPPESGLWGFSLHSPDGTPTPLYDALNTRPVSTGAGSGLYRAQNPHAAYSGLWTFSELGADIGWQRDSRLTFEFNGTAVGLLLRKDDYVGYLYPTVDGGMANALPVDNAGNSYVILTSGSLEPELQRVTVASGLSAGEHTLSLIADRGFDRYALAGFTVSNGDLADPYNHQIAIAALTTLTAFAALLVTAAQINWRPLFAWLHGPLTALGAARQWILAAIASAVLMLGMLLTFGDHLTGILRRDSISLPLALLTSGLLYLNPAFVLALISVLVLLVLVYNRPVIGLALIVFYAPLFLFPVELYRFAFPMAELLTGITAAAWALLMLNRWAHARRSGRALRLPRLRTMDWAMLGWLALGLMSLVWTSRQGVAVTELRVMIFEPVLFYVMFRSLHLEPADIRWLIRALLASGALVAGVGFVYFLQGEAVITAEGEARRMASVYGSPNNVALFLGRCLPFALALGLSGDTRWRRVIGLALTIVMGTAVALTQSVGGLFLGVPAAITVVLLIHYRRRALLPMVGLLVVGVFSLVLLSGISDRFARAFDFTQGTNFYRLRLWESSLEIIADQPVTGLGLDQFLYAFRSTYIRPDAWQEPNLSHPHNVLLDWWIRLGIAGAALFLWIQYRFWRHIWRAASPRASWGLTLKAGTAGAMVNVLAHGLVDNSVYVNDLALVFALLLALAVWNDRHSISTAVVVHSLQADE